LKEKFKLMAETSVWDKLTQHKHFNGLKTATVVFLVLMLVFSVILIGVGAGGIQTLSGFDTILKVTVPAGVIVLGIFLLISTILGLVGIYQKKGKVFAAFLFFLFILIICQFGVGGGAYTWRSQIPTQIEASWRYSLSDNDRNSIQQQFYCCGWWNSTDAQGSNCNSTYTPSTAGFTGSPTTAQSTTAQSTTSQSTTGQPTTSQSTTGQPTTAQSTTAQSTTAQSTTAPTTAPTAQSTTAQSTTAQNVTHMFKRQDTNMDTNMAFTTMMRLPNSSDPACGPWIISASQTALGYVGAVEVAFAVIQLVGLLTGFSMAIWILVQSGKQKFNRLDEEDMGTKFSKKDYTAGGSDKHHGGDDEEDDGMPEPHEPGKRKIVVNFA